MNKISAYSGMSRELICSKAARKTADLVKVDHLAFSFPLANLRHCSGASSVTPNYVYKGTTVYKSTTVFPRVPVVESFTPVGLSHEESISAINSYKMDCRSVLAEYYEKTLSVFIDFILGFELSTPRDKGFHGYSNSLSIRTKNGVDVGFVGIGGQRDTAYIQLSGLACKHLFEYTNLTELHHWLNAVLGVDKLSRVDLARDDFDGNFDVSYAEKAYEDGFFRTGKGGPMPEDLPVKRSRLGPDGKRVYSVEMYQVGIRTSPVYWRIYNKKLEQGIDNEDLSWYRSEVELKKWSVDVLLDLDAAFAGVCPFAESITSSVGIRTKSMNKTKEACLGLAHSVKWIRHAAGRALGDILEVLDGDIEKTLGLILPENTGRKLGLPSTYNDLINHAMGGLKSGYRLGIPPTYHEFESNALGGVNYGY